jgi:hypothetical protein
MRGGPIQSQTPPPVIPRPKDPRLENLKKLNPEAQVKAITQKWYFDRRVGSYNWVIYVLIICACQAANPHAQFLKELTQLDAHSMDLGSIFATPLIMMEFLVAHPIVLLLLTPLFFRFSRPSAYFFEITFDGIVTVKSIEADGTPIDNRHLIKWNELSHIEKVKKDRRQVLLLFSSAGKIGELNWDISHSDKEAMKKIVKGFVHKTNPIRQFLEKDVK